MFGQISQNYQGLFLYIFVDFEAGMYIKTSYQTCAGA